MFARINFYASTAKPSTPTLQIFVIYISCYFVVTSYGQNVGSWKRVLIQKEICDGVCSNGFKCNWWNWSNPFEYKFPDDADGKVQTCVGAQVRCECTKALHLISYFTYEHPMLAVSVFSLITTACIITLIIRCLPLGKFKPSGCDPIMEKRNLQIHNELYFGNYAKRPNCDLENTNRRGGFGWQNYPIQVNFESLHHGEVPIVSNDSNNTHTTLYSIAPSIYPVLLETSSMPASTSFPKNTASKNLYSSFTDKHKNETVL